MDIREQKKKRMLFLYELWKESKGSTSYNQDQFEIGKKLGFDKIEAHNIVEYLVHELLVERYSLSGQIVITHLGIKEIENMIETTNEFVGDSINIKFLEAITSLIEKTEKLQYPNYKDVDSIKREIKLRLIPFIGENNIYLNELEKIKFMPSAYSKKSITVQGPDKFSYGKKETVSLLNIILENYNKSGGMNNQNTSKAYNDIFIVHGHDEELKQAVARAIENLDLKAIILHEQTNKGKTIIEKFMEHADKAGYAVILLSPDDTCYSIENESKKSYRARQNVIFELGFFLGKLGRERVCVIHRKVDNFEIPTDYSGITYITYIKDGDWKQKLAKELNEAGYKIDFSKI